MRKKGKLSSSLLKKAQAALEFLLTYGWAILVVLVVISAMAYFGVLSPSNLLPEKCTFQASFACKDQEAGGNGVQIVLQNSAGKDIRVTSVTFSSDALSSLNGVCSTGAISAVVKNSQQAAFYATDPLNCAFKETGRAKNKYTANITYQFSDSAIPHVVSGEIVARAGSGAISGGSGGYGGGDSSLVGYWKFDSPDPLDDSGTNNNNIVQVLGDPAWQAAGCKSGGCYSFDVITNDNDLLLVADSNSLDLAQLTVTFWTYPAFPTNEWRYAFGKGMNQVGGLAVGHHSASPNNWFIFYGLSTNFFGAYQQNQWAHVAVSYDGATWRTYVNGQPTETFAQAGPGMNNAFNLLIGSGDAKDWNGLIDDFRIYSRVLTPAEIAALAAQ